MITDILKDADLHSEDAVELLMGTAAQESKFGTYMYQLGGGPARGLFQIEPATERDIWENYLKFRPDRTDIVSKYDTPSEDDLVWNLGYQIIMARVHYLRVSEPLPAKWDIKSMAEYWKKHWNTVKGAGTVEEFKENYRRYV